MSNNTWSQTLQRFFASYKLELRLTCWQPLYAIAMVLWGAFIISQYVNDSLFGMVSMFAFVIGMISLIGLFFTGIVTVRLQRSRFDQLEIALPYGAEIVAARWLATITAISGFLVVPILTALFIPSTRLAPDHLVRMVGLCLLSLTFVSGLVWLVQTVWGVRRWMVPLLAGFWLLGGFSAASLRFEGLPVPGSGLANFLTMEASLDSLWGALIQGELPRYFALFYIGVVVCFAGVMLWRTTQRRFYRTAPIFVALTIGALVLMIFAGGSYASRVAATNDEIRVERAHVTANNPVTVSPRQSPILVTAYDVTFAVATEFGQPSQWTAALEVVNRREEPVTEVLFSLNHQFTITSANVAYERAADTWIVRLPQPLAAGATTQIEVAYEGELWITDVVAGRSPEATEFTTPDGVNLNGNILWYPVPGRITPRAIDFDQNNDSYVWSDQTLLDQPARFRLTIAHAGDLEYTSNLMPIDDHTFESAGTTWANLTGAPDLHSTTANGVTVVASARGFELVEPLVRQQYEPFLDYLQRVFPDVQALTVQALSIDNYFFTSAPASAEGLFVRVIPRQLNWLSASPQSAYYDVGVPMVKRLFQGVESDLTENVAFFLYANYMADGNMDTLSILMTGGLPSSAVGMQTYFSTTFAERYVIASALYDIYTTQGETVALDAVRALRDQAATLSIQSQAAIVEAMQVWLQTRLPAEVTAP